MYLLASLPESFGGLIMALETSPDAPNMEVVRTLLHDEQKWKDCTGITDKKALMMRGKHPTRKKVHVITVTR